jgi:hypothetical protein
MRKPTDPVAPALALPVPVVDVTVTVPVGEVTVTRVVVLTETAPELALAARAATQRLVRGSIRVG